MIILRKRFTKEKDVDFCLNLASQLIDRPLLKSHDEYMQSKQELEQNAEIITDALFTLADPKPFEFA